MGTFPLALPAAIPVTQFSDFYRRHADLVYRAALRVTGNTADAEDVLQNVFLKIFHRQDLLDSAATPESYLRRAATNAAIDAIRHRNSRHEMPIPEGVDPVEPAANQALLKERLRRAIARLPARDAELFTLCYIEGFTYDELAEMFQMERGTVGSRLHRIRMSLQQEILK